MIVVLYMLTESLKNGSDDDVVLSDHTTKNVFPT